MKFKKFTIYDPIFGAEICLLLCTAEQYNRYIKKRFPKVKKEDLAVVGDDALYDDRKLPDGTKDRYIWLPDWHDDNAHLTTLQHECNHASEEILKFAGVRRTKASEEVFTYYTAWVYGECLKRLRKGKT